LSEILLVNCKFISDFALASSSVILLQLKQTKLKLEVLKFDF